MVFSPEELERRRQRIHEVKPWEKSTGAKTAEGKMRSSQNALKHGKYSIQYPLRTLARWQEQEIEMERFRAIARSSISDRDSTGKTAMISFASDKTIASSLCIIFTVKKGAD